LAIGYYVYIQYPAFVNVAVPDLPETVPVTVVDPAVVPRLALPDASTVATA
jgi:hypothetical protein